MKNWKCPQCGQISEYEVLCSNCDYEKSFLKWLFQPKNPILWWLMVPLIFWIPYFINLLTNK